MEAKTLNDSGLRRIVAQWLQAGLESSGLNQTSLAERSGVARETIWRLLHGRTDASEWTLRRLAEATGRELPSPLADTRVAIGPTSHPDGAAATADAVGSPARAAGWLFGDPTEAEEQFLSFLRNIERTTRAMVGDPDLFSAEENRINQLAVCRAALRSAERVGRPVPGWLTRIHNEVIRGSFR